MKIRVQHEDGKIEILVVEGQWAIVQGAQLDRMVGSLFEHFFTKDGYYDGWGCVPSPAENTERQIERIESQRQIEPSPEYPYEKATKIKPKPFIQ
jgi:hypothetical protein